MNCLWVFCGHILLYNLPKILSPKNVTLLFKLTKNFVTFVVCFDLPVVVASSAAPEKNSSQQMSQNFLSI